MEEDDIPTFTRFRSKSFRDNEVRVLLKLVAKHRAVVLSKSIANAATRAREVEWEKIAKEFNKISQDVERDAIVLKRKWESLKKLTRKESVRNPDFDPNKSDITRTVVALSAAENGCPDAQDLDLIYGKDEKSSSNVEDKEDWASKDKSSDESNDDENKTQKPKARLKVHPAQMLSPLECKLLLNAVKEEKDVLFSSKSMGTKQSAWKKISEIFNKQSPRKRTVAELSRSFLAMKNVTKKVNRTHVFRKTEKEKYEMLNNSGHEQNIKMEKNSDSSDSDVDTTEHKNVFESDLTPDFNSTNNDPLGANAASSDSGLGFIESSSNKEINNLKLQLLNYEMETARMQRIRLEQAIEADKYEREMRATEVALRLRAARLAVLAAEARLAPAQGGAGAGAAPGGAGAGAAPAQGGAGAAPGGAQLAYTPQEARAQPYMQDYLT